MDTPLGKIVGEKTAKALAVNLDLYTAGDLLYHVPRRYDKRGEHTNIRQLEVGEQVTVMAQVMSTNPRKFRQRAGHILEVIVGDGLGGQLTLTYFNQAWRARDLLPGRWGLFAGKVTEFRGRRQLNGPDYILLDGADWNEEMEAFAGAFIPVYPSAAKIPTWVIARCVRVVLDTIPMPPDPMPSEIRAARKLIDLPTALREIHRPSSGEMLALAKKRLAWDEAFAIQLTLVRRKQEAAQWPAVSRPQVEGGLLTTFDAGLPFQLTEGQLEVGEQISADLATPHPMHRLLQGEVGAGKTLVALRAMLQVMDNGGQAALLAPTEVLAAQHFRGITGLLPLEEQHRVVLLTGSTGAAAKRRILGDIGSGAASLVIGTHALLYDGVDFADLGLIVIDEQHRFGVEQRDALRAKAEQPPHVLVMTATPIPRTVAMTVYGDLEISTLTQLPGGRSPIASHVVPAAEKPAFLERAWQRVREEVGKGHQAYIVCPRIGSSDAASEDEEPPSDAEADSDRRPPIAVLEVAPLLKEGPLSGLRLEILHGKLPADEKDAVMRAFAAGKLDVLVATTVIEVGVDVPNATVMMILDADRFGISQLHQLRGRVGRGSAAGLCLLVTETLEGTPTRERLDSVASTVDGFQLAEIDLEQRREGDVLGAAQSGRRTHLRLLSLLRDRELIGEARAEAEELLARDPTLAEHPLLAQTVSRLVSEDRAEYLQKG
ncbi:ATP-dependent DNA helicase RecG [Rhizocola hellebori]|uniref:Probable DNA 3'-5' helicase RecG n=1 Tax=Rhizocola hellebori TaxID=1392758 RepID=A0A8J3Q717_9ACTN|nr:ATP-dependent DNA helicase RecG [Rhizocola hellebori]GIH04476.1 ATP-dependent DNA helicase RecG [Rhizocola hellebori]